MIILTVDEILAIHKRLASETGGSPELRDIGLLESAVYAADASFGGEEIYPTAKEKAARLAYSLISNHPFVDGNKRIGVFTMLMTLRLNNVKISYTQKELSDTVIDIASGKMSYEDILAWIEAHLCDTVA